MTRSTILPRAENDYSQEWGSQLVRVLSLNFDLIDVAISNQTKYPNLMAPNVTTTQKNAIVNPRAGYLVFDISLSKLCVYSGTAWQTVTSV